MNIYIIGNILIIFLWYKKKTLDIENMRFKNVHRLPASFPAHYLTYKKEQNEMLVIL